MRRQRASRQLQRRGAARGLAPARARARAPRGGPRGEAAARQPQPLRGRRQRECRRQAPLRARLPGPPPEPSGLAGRLGRAAAAPRRRHAHADAQHKHMPRRAGMHTPSRRNAPGNRPQPGVAERGPACAAQIIRLPGSGPMPGWPRGRAGAAVLQRRQHRRGERGRGRDAHKRQDAAAPRACRGRSASVAAALRAGQGRAVNLWWRRSSWTHSLSRILFWHWCT